MVRFFKCKKKVGIELPVKLKFYNKVLTSWRQFSQLKEQEIPNLSSARTQIIWNNKNILIRRK